MKKNTKILNEIKSISPTLASLHGINVFSVPEGYFDTLTDDIQEKVIHTELTDLGASRAPVQQVPEGYFENLSSSILSKIKSADTEEDTDELLAMLPASLRKINVFEVPEGYFESLPAQIMSRVRPQAIVIPMYKRAFFRHAVAAMIAVILFAGTFFTITNQSSKNPNGFSVVSTATVQDANALKYNSQKAFEEGIASLSDDQIIAYLQTHGTILENDVLLENDDATGLPDLQDYLLNDHALDEYLETISLTNDI